jgi:hypothetical protein
MFLGSAARTAGEADNLTANCEPIVYTMWDLYISQPYMRLGPVMGIALLF